MTTISAIGKFIAAIFLSVLFALHAPAYGTSASNDHAFSADASFDAFQQREDDDDDEGEDDGDDDEDNGDDDDDGGDDDDDDARSDNIGSDDAAIRPFFFRVGRGVGFGNIVTGQTSGGDGLQEAPERNGVPFFNADISIENANDPSQPVTLGDDVALNSCGSDFLGVSVCELSSLNEFQFSYTVAERNAQTENANLSLIDQSQTIGTFQNTSTGFPAPAINGVGQNAPLSGSLTPSGSGTQLILPTGPGTFFSAPGEFVVQLTISLRTAAIGNGFLSLSRLIGLGTSTSESRQFAGNSFSNFLNNGFNQDQANTFLTVAPATVASVPEPSAAFLLIPAFAYIARRERKRRK